MISAELLPEVARVADVFRPWGVKLLPVARLRQPAEDRRHRHVRPARSGGRRVLEDEGRRNLQGDPRPRRLRAQGRLRRPARPLRIQPHARRRRQRHRPGPRAARRHPVLPRLRLRPQNGLERSQERPREGRLRQLPSARRQVRSTTSSSRSSTARSTSRSASPRRRCSAGSPKTNQAIELQITQEYLGQQRHLVLPRADVEGGARLRHAGRPRGQGRPQRHAA